MFCVRCNRNLLFNPVLGVCNYPKNVKCNALIPRTTEIMSTIRSLITTSPNPPLTSTSFSPKPIESVKSSACLICVPKIKPYKVLHKIWCHYYYWCTWGIKSMVPKKCKSLLVFNPDISECDRPENTDCGDRSTPSPRLTTPEEYTTTTTHSPRDPNKPRENCPPKDSTEKAQIAHACLCTQYYECVNGEKILKTCPIGKHFDYVKEICDMSAIVKCIRLIPMFDISIFDVQIDDYNITSQ
ncbi:probable chitinase 10 [Monomorium pharaonis]|uniref:probable chitinase 10 n=1 Tax=Monomorium pharaonis TaxID=307658 RepID=UPI00174707E7|nr:probable chitinase 10 [Monomorium pharaonis]